MNAGDVTSTPAGRRLLPFALVAACVPLLFAWATTISSNCPPGDPAGYCRVAGVNRTVFFSAVALPAGVLGGVVGWILPDRKVEALVDRAGFRRIFDPATGTLLALRLLVPAAAAFAPFLFFGDVTARVPVWVLLAVPYYPGLGFLGGVVWASTTAVPSALPYPVLLGLIAASFLVAAAAQAAWFYLLAGAIGRVGSAIGDAVATGRG